MKIRRIPIVLALLVIMTVISGCGNTASNRSNADADNHSGVQGNEAGGTLASDASNGDDKVEIAVYHCTFNIASADSAEVQAVEDSINNYISD